MLLVEVKKGAKLKAGHFLIIVFIDQAENCIHEKYSNFKTRFMIEFELDAGTSAIMELISIGLRTAPRSRWRL